MCHACLLQAIYLLFLTVFSFFISAHVDDHISVLRPGCRLYEKGLSGKTNESSVKNELSVQCKIISTRSLRKFIQNRSARRANDYSIESKRTYFDLKTIPFFSWKSHREQDCPCAKKAKWHPQIKQRINRQLKLVKVSSLKFSQFNFLNGSFPSPFRCKFQTRMK